MDKYNYLICFLLAVLLTILCTYTFSKENKSQERYLIVKAYNPEGGFFWHIYNILCANHEAKKRGMKLVVLFDSGLYLETEPKYQKQYLTIPFEQIDINNWFEYYFQPIGTLNQKIKYLNLNGKLKNLRSLAKYDTDISKDTFYEFDREMFDKRDSSVNYSKEWKECLSLKPHILRKIKYYLDLWQINSDNSSERDFLIAVHRRGTDKYPSHDDLEDSPQMIEFEWIGKKIQDWILQNKNKIGNRKIKIITCSDEKPFLDFMQSYFSKNKNIQILFTDSIRSSYNTSGQHLARCKSADDSSPDCLKYKSMKDQSIHRGMRNLSSYKKGEDAIIEVSLMSICQVFFRSRGNFSNAVTYANPNIQVIDMVEHYDKKK